MFQDKKKNIDNIYWPVFGNIFEPYKYAKVSLIKSDNNTTSKKRSN